MLATLEIPDHDDAVIPATGQLAAIGTHFDRVYCPLMRLSHSQALPAGNLPPAQPASLPPLISTSPPGFQATAEDAPGCPARARTRSPPCASHTKRCPPS